MPKKLALLLFFAPLVAVEALATEVSPSSLNLTQGQQTTVNVSNVSGTLSLTYAAMTVAPTSLTLAVNQTATLTLSNPNGSVSVSTSDKSKVTAYLQDSWITVMGKETGNATLTIKDSMTTLRVPVVVSAANDGNIVGTTEGRLLASNCFQCHGTYGSGGFEQLLGESEAEIYEELVEYQDDPDFTTDIMAAHLQGYTDAQLRAIAKYLANP
jgi:cytochrome c553